MAELWGLGVAPLGGSPFEFRKAFAGCKRGGGKSPHPGLNRSRVDEEALFTIFFGDTEQSTVFIGGELWLEQYTGDLHREKTQGPPSVVFQFKVGSR